MLPAADTRQAIEEAERAYRLKPETPEMMHNLTCIFAQAAGREARKGGDEGQNVARGYRVRAVKLLREALALVNPEARWGFWKDEMLSDRALDPIRDAPE